jgi:hypothetical protein
MRGGKHGRGKKDNGENRKDVKNGMCLLAPAATRDSCFLVIHTLIAQGDGVPFLRFIVVIRSFGIEAPRNAAMAERITRSPGTQHFKPIEHNIRLPPDFFNSF